MASREPEHFVTLEGRLQCKLDLAGLGGVLQSRAKRSYFREKKIRGRSALAEERDCKSKDSGEREAAAKFVSQLVSAGARRDKLSQSRWTKSAAARGGWVPRRRYRKRYSRSMVSAKQARSQVINKLLG